MKALIPFLFTLASTAVFAQSDSARIKKYQLALPEQWMGKKMLLTHLLQIVPSVFPKLEGKQFCLKCKSSYTLMFFYDSVVVNNRAPVSLAPTVEATSGSRFTISNYECVTTFSFKGTWALIYKDSIIAELPLVSPEEELSVRKKFSIQRDIMVSYQDGKKPKMHPNPADNPFQHITSNPTAFDPTIEDILAILQERVKKIKPE